MSDVGEMKAGRELDALVAEKVMGWHYKQVGPTVKHHETGDIDWNYRRIDNYPNRDEWDNYLPPFSTDIATAWDVVEKMKVDGWRVDILDINIRYIVEMWNGVEAIGKADIVPLAICRAALRAVGANDDDFDACRDCGERVYIPDLKSHTCSEDRWRY